MSHESGPLDELAARKIMEGGREIAHGHRKLIAEEIAKHVTEHHRPTPLTRLDPERLTTISHILIAVSNEMERLKVEILTEVRQMVAAQTGPAPVRRPTRQQRALQREIDATVRQALEQGEGAAS